MPSKETIDLYLKHNLSLALVHANTKKPFGDKWNNREKRTKEELYQHCEKDGNLTLVIDEETLIVDIDTKRLGLTGEEAFEDFEANLYKAIPASEYWVDQLSPTVITQSGGYHIYLTIPKKFRGMKLHAKKEKDFPSVDFLSKGSGAIAAGSKVNGKKYVWYDKKKKLYFQEAPEELITYLLKDRTSYTSSKVVIQKNKKLKKIAKKEIQRILDEIPPNCSYIKWKKVARCLYIWDNGGRVGYLMWEMWSEGRDVDQQKVSEDKYNDTESFKEINSVGSLYFIAGIDPSTSIDPDSKEYYEEKMRELPEYLAEVKKDKSPLRAIHPSEQETFCLNDWIYSKRDEKFFNFKEVRFTSNSKFDPEARQLFPKNKKGQPPSSFLRTEKKIISVSYMDWAPERRDEVFYDDLGRLVGNSFDKRTFPEPAESYTDEGLEAIEFIKEHFIKICDSKEYATLLIEWFAFIRQNPGRKNRWCPVVVGTHGVGKSSVINIAKTFLGDKNTKRTSLSEIKSEFNSFAAGSLLVGVDEFHVSGSNRHDIMASMKNVVTEEDINFIQKGKDPINIKNRTNYFFATNHVNALPLPKSERRFFILRSPFRDFKEFEDINGIPNHEYFKRLYKPARDKNIGSQVAKFFQDYEISEKFMNMGEAPITEAAKYMMSTEDTGVYGNDEFLTMIEEGSKYWNKEVILVTPLKKELLFRLNRLVEQVEDYKESDQKATKVREKDIQWKYIFTKAGFSSGRTISINDRSHRYWLHHHMDNDEIRASLQKSGAKQQKKAEELIKEQKGYNFLNKEKVLWNNQSPSESDYGDEDEDGVPF